MYDYIIERINKEDIELIVLDVNGVIKNLCEEHTTALLDTVMRNAKNRMFISHWLVVQTNEIAMFLVRLGLFSLTKRKQNFLIKLYAIILLVNPRSFANTFKWFYDNRIMTYRGIHRLVRTIKSKKKVIFATTSEQAYNIEGKDFEQQNIFFLDTKKKIEVYRQILNETGVPAEKVLIIGDNIRDDMIPARKLGTKRILTNSYGSKIKSVFCKMINKKIK